jgi:GNAT superfamily N-acetyltransferase
MGHIVSIQNKNLEIVRISFLNFRKAFGFAKNIFPDDVFRLFISYFFSQMPKGILPWISKAFSTVGFGHLDYYAAIEKSGGKIVGITGLYAIKGKQEAWVGWFGIDPDVRGQGYGSALLDWTIETAKDEGFDTLRLWTKTNKTYRRANEMYASKGFTRQDIGVADPECPNEHYVLYARGLAGQQPEPFVGSLREALLGESSKIIEKGLKIYHQRAH